MCRVGNRGLGLKEEEVRAVSGKVGDKGTDILIARGAGKDSCQIVKDRQSGDHLTLRQRGGGSKHSSLI